MTAAAIAEALRGQRAGGCWMARCPAHDDTTPSLAIAETADGKILVRCHAGCEQAAVIAALRERGLWTDSSRQARIETPERGGRSRDDDTRRRTVYALRIWCASKPATGTLAEVYLGARAITLRLPPSLRFHPSLRHPDGGAWPALVGLVTRGERNAPVGVHRTFLARDGRGKAPIGKSKLMLGPCRGGTVRLGPLPTSGRLLIGEGIETCLAAMQATGEAAWAALSTSGLRTLDVPAAARDITILADGDPAGEVAAVASATRWAREGRRVRIARAPTGADFNDLLLGSTAVEPAP